jgi:hypothetical protein
MVIEAKTDRKECAEFTREQQVLAALKKIKFGSVEIIVHEGEVVQIESKEKVRFTTAR